MFSFHVPLRRSKPIPFGVQQTNNVDKSINGCLVLGFGTILIGLLLLGFGSVSNRQRVVYISVGTISFAIGFFLLTLTCFFTQFNVWYNRWAYRSCIRPLRMEIQTCSTMANSIITELTNVNAGTVPASMIQVKIN